MEDKFNYMMLSRLQADCDYFLGYGGCHVKHLWADSVSEHIAEMKRLHSIVPIKPEWLSMEDILEYEKAMSNQVEISEIRSSWSKFNRFKTIGDRISVIVQTEYDRGKFNYGVQFWTQEKIEIGSHTNDDRTISKFIEKI